MLLAKSKEFILCFYLKANTLLILQSCVFTFAGYLQVEMGGAT